MTNERKEQWAYLKGAMERYTDNADEIIEAMQDLYSIYDEEYITWLAALYDKDTGAFYFSNSGRDNSEFLPDIESTVQAVNNMLGLGLISSPDELPDEMKAGITRFTRSLLDPEDGFFYHPQWGKNIVDSRRGRDLNWALQLSNHFKFDFPYPTANERLAEALKNQDSEGTKAIPDHLKSAEALRAYLDNYDWDMRAYYAANNICSQMSSVVAAGLEDVVIDYLNEKQNPETGLWGSRGLYSAVNALLKISAAYETAKRPIPNATKAALAAMECMIHEDDPNGFIRGDDRCWTVCHIYNCWFSIRNILNNLKRRGLDKEARDLLSAVYKVAPEAIRASKKKILLFKKSDSSFTYDLEVGLKGVSQEAPVCLSNIDEGSINSSAISTTGLTNNIYMALGIEDEYIVKIFGPEKKQKFLESLNI